MNSLISDGMHGFKSHTQVNGSAKGIPPREHGLSVFVEVNRIPDGNGVRAVPILPYVTSLCSKFYPRLSVTRTKTFLGRFWAINHIVHRAAVFDATNVLDTVRFLANAT
jgi:hypothetical protein